MDRINRENVLYAAALTIIILIIAILNKNYLISVLFFAGVLLGLYIIKPGNFQERLYSTLMVSAIFENTYYVPGHEKIYIFHIVLAVFTIVTLVKIFRDRSAFSRFNRKAIIFYGIWFAYMVLGGLWAANKSLYLKYIFIYIMMFAFLFDLIAFNNSRERFKKSVKIMGMMFLFALIIGLLEGITGHLLPVKHHFSSITNLTPEQLNVFNRTSTAFFFNPNNFGTFITICMPFVFTYFYYTEKLNRKLLFFLWTLLTFVVLVFSSSRTNIYAAAFSIAVFIVIVLRERGLKALIYPLILIIGFTVAYKYSDVLSNNNYYFWKMNSVGEDLSSDAKIGAGGSVNERLTIYYDVFDKIILQKNFLGLGAGNTQQLLIEANNTHGIIAPHGLVIELLGDFGLPIILLYGAFYIYLLYSLNREWKNKDLRVFSNALLLSLLAFALGSFSPSSVTYFLPNWILFGHSIALIQIGREESRVF